MEIKAPDFVLNWDDDAPSLISDIEAEANSPDGDSLSYVGGLFDIPNVDRWTENIFFPDEYINELSYQQIQSDNNEKFEIHWSRKMRRQRDGIV